MLGTYERNKSKIAVKCDICGWEWTPIPYSLLKGHGCPKCARVKQKTHAEFVEELQSQRDDVVLIGRYVKALEKAKFRCLKCGHEWNVTPAHILSGRGCPACALSRRGASQRLTMELFLERLHEIDPNLVVRKDVEYRNNRTRMPLRCKACGYEYEITPHDVLHSRGCPNCHRACTSFLEQFIYHSFVRVLGESKVLSRDKTAIGAELDIYIPELKAAIEPGSWYWHKNLVARDRKKHRICNEKGIKLVTIYDHYDNETLPFDNCFVTDCDLAHVSNRNKPILVQCAECNRIWHAWPGSLLKGGGCKVCKSKQAIRQRNRKIRCITTGEIFNTLREAAEKYNVSPSSVCICCTNLPKRKHAGGLEWEYILI